MSEKKVNPYKRKRVFLDKKVSMIVYAATLIIATVCRTVQLNTNMDFATGKYIDGSLAKNSTLFVLIIGFLLIAAVMVFGESRDKAVKSCILLNPMRLKADRLRKKISPKAAVGMFVMAVFIAYQLIQDIVVYCSYNRSISTEDDPVFLFANIPVMSWVNYVLMIILIAAFISTGVNILKGEGITPGNCFFLTVFPIWKLLEIFDLIITYQVIGPYSEKCYMLLSDMASAMFFLMVARFFAGFEKKRTRYWMILFGYYASILAVVSSVPRYVMFFTKHYSLREGMLTPEVSDIGVAIVTIMIVAVFWSTYVYRVMPKLNLLGKRRWAARQTEGTKEEMEAIDEKK